MHLKRGSRQLTDPEKKIVKIESAPGNRKTRAQKRK